MKSNIPWLIQKNAFVLGVVACLVAGTGWSLAEPIAVTGYNYDVIYESSATGAGNGSFTNESSALYEDGLAPAPNGGNGHGLPADRVLAGLNGETFLLSPYTAPNALMVGEGNGLGKFATWTFANKVPYSKLSVLGLCAGGQGNFSMVVFFTDGTNTGAGTEIEGRFDIRGQYDGQTMPDWFNNGGTSAGAVATGLGRVDSNNGGGNGVGVNLQQFDFDLSAHTGKSVDHVEFESTSGTGNNRAFLAISGVPVAQDSTFRIKSYLFKFDTDELLLTWVSEENETYRIVASEDLVHWDTELVSGIAGAAGAIETTYITSFDQGTHQFFRVEKEVSP